MKLVSENQTVFVPFVNSFAKQTATQVEGAVLLRKSLCQAPSAIRRAYSWMIQGILSARRRLRKKVDELFENYRKSVEKEAIYRHKIERNREELFNRTWYHHSHGPYFRSRGGLL